MVQAVTHLNLNIDTKGDNIQVSLRWCSEKPVMEGMAGY